MERGAWCTTIHGVTKGSTQLSDLHFSQIIVTVASKGSPHPSILGKLHIYELA